MKLFTRLKSVLSPRPPAPDLEEVWRIREEDVYPRLFGPQTPGIYPLDAVLFTELGREGVDPRWLHHGVIEFPPTDARSCWLYVTSGRSNPWQTEPRDYDPNGPSGAGVEFLFATETQGQWAIRFLQKMLAYNLLLGAGHFPGREGLVPGDRIPLRGPIDGKADCPIRNAVVSQPDTLPDTFQLPSGHVHLLTFTGITDADLALGQTDGHDALIAHLMAEDRYPVTRIVP